MVVNLWADGRTSEACRVAADAVLKQMGHVYGPLERQVGTVFQGPNDVFWGRTSSTDHLGVDEMLWTKLGQGLLRQMIADAESRDKRMVVLFISLDPDSLEVHYWTVPGRKVAELLDQLGPDAHLRIYRNIDGYSMGYRPVPMVDITEHHHQLEITTEQREALEQAIRRTKAEPAAADTPSADGWRNHEAEHDVVATDHPQVVQDPRILGGEPVIRGTRTPVRAIVELTRAGFSPAQIAESLPHLKLARVYDALSYHDEHRDQIERHIVANRGEAEALEPVSHGG